MFNTIPVIGIDISITARPAKTDGPKIDHKKYMAIAICNGADHIKFMYSSSSLSIINWLGSQSNDNFTPKDNTRESISVNAH